MADIFFRAPSGESHENPAREWLKELIFDRGDDFWDVETGEAVVEYREDGRRKSKLLLTGLEEYGFMLHHYFASGDERELVLTSGEPTGEVVEAVIGGEPVPCRREYFVPRETAWEAVAHFLQTGERKAGLNWQAHQTPEAV